MTFKVFVNGENYEMNVGGQLQLVGFFTTRFVEANSREEAERLALTSIERDLPKDVPSNSALKIASVEVIEIGAELPQDTGFSFYLMEDSSGSVDRAGS